MTICLTFGLTLLAVLAQAQTKANPADAVFGRFSTRANQVVFVARLKAGQRGGKAISVDDLITALIIEDQGGAVDVITSAFAHETVPETSRAVGPFVPPHQPFFNAQTASNVLQRIEATLERTTPVPSEADMRMSPSLARALLAAVDLADSLKQEKVQPLHLLAVAMTDESSKAARLLTESGITQEKVVKAIREQQ